MTEKTLNTLALILNSFTFGSLPFYTHALTHTCRHTHTHMHTYTNTLSLVQEMCWRNTCTYIMYIDQVYFLFYRYPLLQYHKFVT